MIAKRPCLEQSDNDDNDEVDPVPMITHAEAKLRKPQPLNKPLYSITCTNCYTDMYVHVSCAIL